MVIAVPTGIKIFSWLSHSFSKSNMAKIYVITTIIFIFYNNCFNFYLVKIFVSNYTSVYGLSDNFIILNKFYLFTLHTGNLLEIFPRSSRNYMPDNNDCKAIVVYGTNLQSAVNLPKFTSIVTYMVNIPKCILDPLVGVLLSDGCISNKKLSNSSSRSLKNVNKVNNLTSVQNCRFRFKQSLDHSEYLFYVFNKVSPYCISYPRYFKTRLNRKDFYGIEIVSRGLPCMTILRNIFYLNGKKIIPLDLYNLLTYEGLAHIIMSDGSFKSKGINLNLQSFSLKELIFFINILKIKFDLDCTLHKSRYQYTVYIKVASVKKLYPYIKEYIIPSMKYKIEGKLKTV